MSEMRLLIVDDSEDDAMLVVRELQRGGFEVFWKLVETREALLSTLQLEEWDCIVSDYSIPGFGGFEALSIVKTSNLDIPFIMISGTVGESIAVEVMRRGAQDFVLKNNLVRLVEAIKRELADVEQRRQRKQAERSLLESEERYRTLVETSPDSIILTDLDLNILFCNQKALNSYGIQSIDLVLGKNMLSMIHPDDLPHAKEMYQRLIESGTIHNIELTEIDIFGTSRLIDISASMLHNTEGKPFSIIHIVRDITERKRLEQQLIQVQKFESIGTLASGISHDFNNILNTISGFAEQLKVSCTNEEKVLKYAGIIESSAQRGIELTKQLTAFVRQTKKEKGPVHIDEGINEILALIHETFPVNIKVRTNIENNLPAVYGNKTELYQVFLNLVINSRDAMPAGGTIMFTARQTCLPDSVTPIGGVDSLWRDRQGIEVCVSDTGTGIPESIRMKIFDPFFTTKEAGKGTGLGLSIVYTILRDHHGALMLDSDIGKGTTFRIYLPIASLMPELDQVFVDGQGNGETILIVDDDEAIQQLCRNILERAGYEVLEAQDGEAAIEIYKNSNKKISLVILDLVMPIMNGKEVYEELAKLDPDLKALFYTGFSHEHILDLLPKEKRIRIFQKPLRSAQFLKMVQESLARK